MEQTDSAADSFDWNCPRGEGGVVKRSRPMGSGARAAWRFPGGSAMGNERLLEVPRFKQAAGEPIFPDPSCASKK